MLKIDYSLAKRPFNNDDFCGDTGMVKEFDGRVFIGIVDALRHGEKAHKIAEICHDFMEKNYRGEDLSRTMEGLDECLRGTRGAVAALCLLDLETGEMRCVGIAT